MDNDGAKIVFLILVELISGYLLARSADHFIKPICVNDVSDNPW